MFVNICTTFSPYSYVLIIKTIYMFSDQYHRITESLLQSMNCCRLCASLWMAIWDDSSNPWEICGSAGTAKISRHIPPEFREMMWPQNHSSDLISAFWYSWWTFWMLFKKNFIQNYPFQTQQKPTTQPCKVVIVDMNEDRIKRWNSDMAKSWAKHRLHLSAWSAGGSGWW